MRAVWLFSRNDAAGNAAVIVAGALVLERAGIRFTSSFIALLGAATAWLLASPSAAPEVSRTPNVVESSRTPLAPSEAAHTVLVADRLRPSRSLRGTVRRSTVRNSSTESRVTKPGIDSSLSSVPPLWPRPRPDIIGT